MFEVITDSALALFSEIFESGEAEGLTNLLEAEQTISTFGRELVRRLAQRYVELSTELAKASRPTCLCGKQIPVHRQTTWTRRGLAGELSIQDPYCYCKRCEMSLRPLHALLGTQREKWSLDLERIAVDFASDESCEKAVKKLARTYPGVEMGRTTALHLLHEHGEKARAFVGEKIHSALRDVSDSGGCPELEVEYDGGMIPTAVLAPAEDTETLRTPVRNLPKRRRVCEWKEAKVGLVQVPGEVGRLYTARPTNELDEVFRDLLGLASLKGLGPQTQVRGIADGAPYIRQRLERTFENHDFRFILDRPHAKQHLHAAGEQIHPFDEGRRARWIEGAWEKIEAGLAMKVVGELRKLAARNADDELRRAADYFERNADAVSYQDYRSHGWSTASSEVESGHRHVVQVRLKIPGAWWHPDKVSNILALRILKANPGWWDEYWKTQNEVWMRQAADFRGVPEQRAA